MRVLTALAPPDLEAARAITGPDGMPLVGRGTRLSRRYLRMLHDEGLRVVEVQDDPRVEAWERIPTEDEYLRALDARFRPVDGDRNMTALKDAVRAVYLGFIRELEAR